MGALIGAVGGGVGGGAIDRSCRSLTPEASRYRGTDVLAS